MVYQDLAHRQALVVTACYKESWRSAAMKNVFTEVRYWKVDPHHEHVRERQMAEDMLLMEPLIINTTSQSWAAACAGRN